MHFNERQYDRLNAISLIALGGASLSLVYLVCAAIASIASNGAVGESASMTGHMVVAGLCVMIFLVIGLIVGPRYERLNDIKELINEFYQIFATEKVEQLSQLSSKNDRDIIIHAFRRGRGYGLSVEDTAGLHTLTITREGLVLFSPNPLVQCDTEEFARAVLAYLNGDQFALRGVLSKADRRTVAS